MIARVQERLVIIGGSAAGLASARTALALDPRTRIDVVCADTDAPFYRPGLSKQLLKGTWTPEQASQPVPTSENLHWHSGVSAVAMDRDRQRVHLGDGGYLPFDRLVIACGCRPRRLDVIRGRVLGQSRRLFEANRIGDIAGIRATLPPGGHAVVIGAGLIGSEVASTLASSGVRVTMVDPSTAPLVRALGVVGNVVCGRWHRASPIDVRLGCAVAGVSERANGIDVELSDGESVSADIAISCLGVVPDTGWLSDAGLPLTADGAVSCDEHLIVSGVENVAAAGDVASWQSVRAGFRVRVEHWLTAVEQGAAAAKNLLSDDERREPFDAVPMFWTEQHGHLVHFVGHHNPQSSWSVVEGTEDDDRMVAVAASDGLPTGYLLVNAAQRLSHYRSAIGLTGAELSVT